jgi:hypothetical protein
VTQQKYEGVTLWDPSANNQVLQQIELKDFKVNLDLVHLNTTERCMLRSKPIDILFEQRQRNEFMIEPQSKVGTFNLDFKNCVKELFFIAKKTGKWSDEQISNLNELYDLDQYTDAQKERLTILKLIPVWGGIVTTALDSLVGETDEDVRTAAINAMLQAIYWGETTPYVGYLEDLKDPSIDPGDQTTYINDLKEYIAGIPSQIITSQINATSNLNALIGKDSEIERIDIIDNNLLTIQNFWGEEQEGILQLLKSTDLSEYQEELLIFGLRAHLTTASYYLSGLSELKPGATDQVATVTKLTEFLDNTKTEFDIIKLGMKAVLDSIPGKTEYLRARIVGALLKLGGATLWGDTESDQRIQLESLLINPGNDTDTINTQAATITGLKAYLDGVYNQLGGVKKFVHEKLNTLHGETDGPTRVGIVDGLLTIPNFWTTTEEGYLDDLKNPQVADEDVFITNLRVYTDNQESGIKEIVDMALTDLAGETDEDTRVGIVGDLLEIGKFWTTTEEGYLDDLKNPQVANEADLITNLRVYTNAKVTGVQFVNEGMLDVINDITSSNVIVNQALDNLDDEENEITRKSIVDNIVAIPNYWDETRFNNLHTLKTYGLSNEDTLISDIRTYADDKQASTPTPTFEERIASVEVLRQTPIWGDDIIKLVLDYDNNDQTYPPILTGILGAIPTLKFRLNALKGGINGVLDTLPNINAQERDPIMLGIATSYAWSDEAFGIINALRTPSPTDDATRITALKQKGIEENVPNMTGYTQFDQNNVIDGIISLNLWGEAYYDLNDLRQITPGLIGESNVITALVAYLTAVGGPQNAIDTISGISAITDTEERATAVANLEEEEVWGETQLLLLKQLYIVGSVNHAGFIDDYIISHLNTLSITLGTLLTDIDDGTATTSTLTDNVNKKAAWGGYFYYLLEDLKNPLITEADVTDNVTKLTTYVNITSLSETRNNNLKFLITQLTVAYPESIFNKWVRAKKNVPLMYSKQKTTTLDCDGTQILDKTTGSNIFLSASLPNLYHKRSPNFRNINMYSFALYPDELRPSGHLNFSTIKDARVTMELEYDGRHGTFDFDDNYIEVFGIEPIYFPKQVIIIAKSYNMMIIRNGEARIIY